LTKSASTTWLFQPDVSPPWVFWDDAFTMDECSQIIQYGESLGLTSADVSNPDGSKQVTEVRDSMVSLITPNIDTSWIFQRLTDVIQSLNSQYYKFDIYGLVEGLQFTRYDAPSGFYTSHIDCIPNGPVRKLSITMQLSDQKEYDGGTLEIQVGHDSIVCPREKGKIILFPSYSLHRVTPVTKGSRYSLVCWVTGPAFK
jgi:PKHD-type hydroxylase